MQLRLLAHLPASPAVLWPLLTDPSQMCTWSTAPVRGLVPGEGGRWDVPGAVRRVTVHAAGAELSVDEVVIAARPPNRFAYAVFRGLPVRLHAGEMRIDPVDGGSVLAWDVRVELVARALEAGAQRLLRRQLTASLAALRETVARGPALGHAEPATGGDVVDDSPVGARRAARRVLRAQRALAARLDAEQCPERFFAHVYHHVTAEQLAGVDAGRFRHPAWVCRVITAFHPYWADALARWRGEAGGSPDEHWRVAFEDDRLAAGQAALPRALRQLRLSVIAHIEEDLPRALAAVWLRHYRGRLAYDGFRGDFVRMGDSFHHAAARVLAAGDPDLAPWTRLHALPLELRSILFRLAFYDVARQRLRAFDRGRRIVAMVAGEASSPHVLGLARHSSR